MNLTSKRHGAILLLTVCMLLSGAASPAMAQKITQPEKLLFQTNHFSNVRKPTRLGYSYHQEATAPNAPVASGAPGAAGVAEPATTASEAFDDDVVVDVVKRNDDGTASVSAKFLSGSHEIQIPPIDNAQGNPALLGFLERDILEMKRLTGGATGYFRKRIRLSLASPTLPVKKIDLTYEGKPIHAQEITIHPYQDDPLKERFGKFGDKGYVFIISDAVPGSLYRIYTTIKGDRPAPAVDASMTLARTDMADMKKTGMVAQRR